MQVSDAIKTRRAVKTFDPNHRMTEAEFQTLMEHALLSPTAFNIQHWRFVRVNDPAQRQAIRQLAWNQPQVTDASLLLVMCIDLMAWDKTPQRYWRNAPKEIQDTLLPAIHQYYANHAQVQRDEGMRSCGIAAMTLMLTARALGYDSCPMDGFDFDGVAKLINLPADHAICMMIAIGKSLADPFPRGGQLALDEVLVENRF